MKVVMVGEAWGKREAQMQHALVGPTGRELSLMLGQSNFAPFMLIRCRECKLDVEYTVPFCPNCGKHIWPNEFTLMDHWKRLRAEHGIAVTNVFNTRPPDNKLGHFFGTTSETIMPAWKASKDIGGSHLRAEHFHHVARLWREIEDLKPTLVMALGNAACWALLFQTGIRDIRGTVTWSDRCEVKVLPTYHPANILRDPVMRPTVLADFTKAGRERDFPEIRRPTRYITVPSPDSDGLREAREWFERPARAYAVDIETYRGLITMAGFARSQDDALVIPFRRPPNQFYWSGPSAEELNFWPSKDLEIAAWKQVIAGLATPQAKIFQNGLYDISYFLRMGIHVRNALHDTMLWHHSLYPELPKSLGYLGSLYCNEIAWKTMRRSESAKRDE